MNPLKCLSCLKPIDGPVTEVTGQDGEISGFLCLSCGESRAAREGKSGPFTIQLIVRDAGKYDIILNTARDAIAALNLGPGAYEIVQN